MFSSLILARFKQGFSSLEAPGTIGNIISEHGFAKTTLIEATKKAYCHGATIAKELLTIAQKERAADQTDAAAVLAAEDALESSLKDLSDDSMSLLTSVYEVLDVIDLLQPEMVEDNSREGTFNTSS